MMGPLGTAIHPLQPRFGAWDPVLYDFAGKAACLEVPRDVWSVNEISIGLQSFRNVSLTLANHPGFSSNSLPPIPFKYIIDFRKSIPDQENVSAFLLADADLNMVHAQIFIRNDAELKPVYKYINPASNTAQQLFTEAKQLLTSKKAKLNGKVPNS